ncbi:MAG: hypothetical protein PHD99_04785 [Candidatus Moranbacteria bacterium]|nr:hypothetical protein [Candidatus Moranbacteria bacterium]
MTDNQERRRATDLLHHPHNATEPCPGGCDDIVGINTRLDDGDNRMTQIEKDLAEVLDILRMGKSFFKAAGYFGVAVKWVVGIAVPLVSLYYALTAGRVK